MTIIESLYHYLDACPLLQDRMLYVDYLGPDPVSYVIDVEPATAIVKRYTNGDTIRQYLFTFGTRDYYSQDVMERIDSSGFFEEFSDWLETQNNQRNLPQLPEGKESRSIGALSTGYLYDEETNTARYQIQCGLTYFQRRL
nr:hypothetical protein [uncultured Solibaculum sp.]